jgi:hypothetical protein
MMKVLVVGKDVAVYIFAAVMGSFIIGAAMGVSTIEGLVYVWTMS